MNDKIRYQFELLCKKAEYSWEGKKYGTTGLEPYLLDILEFVKKNIKYRKELAQCFINIVNDYHYGPDEIVIFCMRELQWEEVLEAAIQTHAANRDPRVKAAMNHIIEVYDPDWEDYDLYLYYCGKVSRSFLFLREKIKKSIKSNPEDKKEIEKNLLQMLNFIKDHMNNKQELTACFVNLVNGYQLGSYEIVSFCMRELQWPEIKEAIILILDITDDEKEKSELQDMLTVYGPHWKDANLYEYYKNK